MQFSWTSELGKITPTKNHSQNVDDLRGVRIPKQETSSVTAEANTKSFYKIPLESDKEY